MQYYLPGSAVKINDPRPETIEFLLSSLFAGGGLMLSQVAHVTGLEPYLIQNWVARGFLSSPQNKLYTRRQLSRILIINMLRSTLSLDRICKLLSYINGHLDDESDDAIDDSQMYLYLVRLNCSDCESGDYDALLADYEEPFPGARNRLIQILKIMSAACRSAELKSQAEELIAGLDEL